MEQNSKAIYWVWLSLCFPVASERVAALLEETDPETFYHEKTAYPFLKPADLQAIQTISLERAGMVLEKCEKAGAKVLTMEDEDYPESLLHIYCPPPVLYVRGNLGCLRGRLSVSVVGTRKAYDYYLSAAGNVSYQLAQAGAAVISGCAVGTDSYAHLGCMRGGGPTVGVLACGIDVDYPKESHDLKEAIVASGGALITELEPGRKVPPGYFHARNRLIAGLSDCVLLGQVPLRSGAMITANAAIDQGKDLFCLPPTSIYDARCMGVAAYVRDGAKLAFSAYDIVMDYASQYPDTLHPEVVERQPLFVVEPEEKGEIPLPKKASRRKKPDPPDPPEPPSPDPAPPDGDGGPDDGLPPLPEERPGVLKAAAGVSYRVTDGPDGEDSPRRLILSLLSDEPRLIDDLAAACGLPVGSLLQTLTELELEGAVEAMSGSRFRLAR